MCSKTPSTKMVDFGGDKPSLLVFEPLYGVDLI